MNLLENETPKPPWLRRHRSHGVGGAWHPGGCVRLCGADGRGLGLSGSSSGFSLGMVAQVVFCLAKCSKCCVQLIAAVTFLLAPVFVCARTHTHTGGRGDSGSSKSDCARAPSLLHLLHLAPWGSSPVTSAAFDRKVHTHTLPPPQNTHTCTHAHMHTHMHTCTHAHGLTHTHMHVHRHVT